MRASSRAGFTLIELSISIAIIGLLIGGVLAGQSLIRASQTRSVITQVTQFDTAFNAFRDKYGSMPGDMKDATTYWGKDDSYCSGDSGAIATPGTCNGNGDNVLGDPEYGGALAYEGYRAWQHLALAGLIPGTYTGVSYAGMFYSVPGLNVPASKLPNVGYTFQGGVALGVHLHPGAYYPIASSQIISIGTAVENDTTENPFLTPSEAYNLDVKIDDGKPGTGIWTTWIGNGCTDSGDPATANFILTEKSIVCAFNIEMK